MVVERRRAAPYRQISARYIGPAAVAVESDVDAVIVGAKRLFEKGGRANPEAGIAAPRLYRNALVVRLRRSTRQHHLPARNGDGLHNQPGGRFPQPITDLIVEGDGFLRRVDMDVVAQPIEELRRSEEHTSALHS